MLFTWDDNVSSSERLPYMDIQSDSAPTYVAENELMRAIILRTVEDYNAGGELRTEAVAYMSDEDDEYIFSFVFIYPLLNFF